MGIPIVILEHYQLKDPGSLVRLKEIATRDGD